jgi:hypothetical protein
MIFHAMLLNTTEFDGRAFLALDVRSLVTEDEINNGLDSYRTDLFK